MIDFSMPLTLAAPTKQLAKRDVQIGYSVHISFGAHKITSRQTRIKLGKLMLFQLCIPLMHKLNKQK